MQYQTELVSTKSVIIAMVVLCLSSCSAGGWKQVEFQRSVEPILLAQGGGAAGPGGGIGTPMIQPDMPSTGTIGPGPNLGVTPPISPEGSFPGFPPLPPAPDILDFESAPTSPGPGLGMPDFSDDINPFRPGTDNAGTKPNGASGSYCKYIDYSICLQLIDCEGRCCDPAQEQC